MRHTTRERRSFVIGGFSDSQSGSCSGRARRTPACAGPRRRKPAEGADGGGDDRNRNRTGGWRNAVRRRAGAGRAGVGACAVDARPLGEPIAGPEGRAGVRPAHLGGARESPRTRPGAGQWGGAPGPGNAGRGAKCECVAARGLTLAQCSAASWGATRLCQSRGAAPDLEPGAGQVTHSPGCHDCENWPRRGTDCGSCPVSRCRLSCVPLAQTAGQARAPLAVVRAKLRAAQHGRRRTSLACPALHPRPALICTVLRDQGRLLVGGRVAGLVAADRGGLAVRALVASAAAGSPAIPHASSAVRRASPPPPRSRLWSKRCCAAACCGRSRPAPRAGLAGAAGALDLTPLTAIGSVDGRYSRMVADLRPYFGEFALIKYRVLVEVAWLKTLANCAVSGRAFAAGTAPAQALALAGRAMPRRHRQPRQARVSPPHLQLQMAARSARPDQVHASALHTENLFLLIFRRGCPRSPPCRPTPRLPCSPSSTPSASNRRRASRKSNAKPTTTSRRSSTSSRSR